MSASRLYPVTAAVVATFLVALTAPVAMSVDCSGSSEDGDVTVEVRIDEPEAGGFVASGPPCATDVPVSGVASAVGLPPTFDVYIALDVSGSTACCAGSDIDGDGEVGEKRNRSGTCNGQTRNFCSGCTDFGDSIYQAEVEAVRRLVETFDLDRTRVGIVAFSDPARTREVLSLTDDPAAIEAALDDLASGFPFGATDFEGPQLLVRQRFIELGDPDRKWILMFLSDGAPTFPQEPFCSTERADADAATAAARQLAARDITIHSYAVGQFAAQSILRQMSGITGGRSFRVQDPSDLLDLLPSSVLTGIDLLVVENLTTGDLVLPELSPMGEFSAFLPVTHGWNEIRVTAQAIFAGNVQVDCPVRFFAACGRGCDPSTQGFWHRQCLATGEIRPGGGGPDLDLLVPEFPDWQEIVDLLLADTGQDTCEALDAAPPSDPCERALKQTAAFLLNLADGRLGADCSLDAEILEPLLPEGTPLPETVGEAMELLETLLLQGLADEPDLCKVVADLADAVNTGVAVGEPDGTNVRLVAQPSLQPSMESKPALGVGPDEGRGFPRRRR